MPQSKRQNFAHTKLVGLSFDRKNLSSADFSNAYINNCSFKRANLSGANFSYARIGHSRNTTRRKIASALVTAGTTITVLLIARLNNSAFATASTLAILMVIIAQFYKYTPAHVWLWAAALPASFYLSVAGAYRAYTNTIGFPPIAIAYGITSILFASISITFSSKLVEGIRSTGATFFEANLTHANFSNARIEQASFLRAKLNHVTWLNAVLGTCKFSVGAAPSSAQIQQSEARSFSTEEHDIRIT